MNSAQKHLCLLIAITIAAATAATAGDSPASTNATNSAKTDDLFPDRVVAKGKGFEIKQSKLDAALINAKMVASARGMPAGPSDLMEKRALDYLILVQMVNQKATDAQKAVGIENAKKSLAQVEKQATSEEFLVRQLKPMGMTLDSYRQSMTEEAIFQVVMRDKAAITDDRIKKFYEENPAQFEESEQVHISYIALGLFDSKSGQPLTDDQKKAKKTLAEDLVKRARAGEDFAKLAREYSDANNAKEDAGEIKLARGMPRVPPEFEAAAFSLKTNTISEVISTDNAYFIIKFSDRIPPGKASLTDASPRIKTYLEGEEIDKILPVYEKELRKEAAVEILDDKLKSLEDAGQSPVLRSAPSAATLPKGDGK